MQRARDPVMPAPLYGPLLRSDDDTYLQEATSGCHGVSSVRQWIYY